ncbi:MAG: phosphatidylserine decarboxylase [Acetobacter sp.]|nr:phosphatidylserine decarboxylase [Acetobacter sp.]
MSLFSSLKLVLSRPHPEAYPFLVTSALISSIAYKASHRLRCPLLCGIGHISTSFFAFCLYFFRDPERVTPTSPHNVVAPADGRIVSIEKITPPQELGLGTTPVWRIATFLSMLNVHVNRVPATGVVTRVVYTPGLFINANLDKASEDNERNALTITLPDNRTLAVVQIAGLVARRIVCSVTEGTSVQVGERFGLIRFGSRTDVYLPPDIEPLVSVGQTMVGGETIMAHL